MSASDACSSSYCIEQGSRDNARNCQLGYMKMRELRRWIGIWIIGATYGAAATAHHSFLATYLVDQRVKIEGEVVQLLFRNPHSFIHVMAPDPDGKMQRWAVEWAGAAGLQHEEVSHETVRPGDHVIVTGNPGRNPEDHRILLRSIVRPSDGWTWSGTFQ